MALHFSKGTDRLEHVQKRATKVIGHLEDKMLKNIGNVVFGGEKTVGRQGSHLQKGEGLS